MLLSGEPGIGKSRLLIEFEKRLAAEDYEPLRYFCSPLHTTGALHPIAARWEQEGKPAHGDSGQERLRKIELAVWREKLSAEESALVAATLGIPLDGRDPLAALTPQQRKKRTFDLLYHRLIATARERPLLMLFEDAQWADQTSLELFDELIGRIERLPILLVVSFRPEFGSSWSGLPGVIQITLGRLDREEASEVIKSVNEGRALPAGLSKRIVEQTDGVPLFIEEMTKAIIEARPATPDGPLALPASLQASIMARLDRMPVAKRMAQLGAVIGRQFPVALLRIIANLPDGQVDDGIEELVASSLAFSRGQTPEEVCTFKHALVQEVAYDSLLRTARREVHQRVAEALRDRFPERATAQPEVVAHHFSKADLTEDAIEWWGRAGDLAQRRAAFTDAVQHLETALRLTVRLPHAEDRRQILMRLQLAYGHALRIERGFAMPETQAAFAAACDLAMAKDDIQVRFPACYGMWSGSFFHGDLARMRKTAAICLWDARELSGSPESAVAHRIAGMTHWFAGNLAKARVRLERALAIENPVKELELAHTFGQDPDCTAMIYLALALWPTGALEQATALLDEAVVRAKETRHFPTIAYTHLHLAIFEMMRRAPARAASHVAAIIHDVREYRMAVWVAFGRFLEGWLAWNSGDLTNGSAIMREGLTLMRDQQQQRLFMPMVMALFAETEARSGHTEAGLAMLEDELEAIERTGQRWCLSEIHRIRGELLRTARPPDAAAAEAAFVQAMKIARAQKAELFELQAAVALGQLWERAGKNAAARALVNPIYRRLVGRHGQTAGYEAFRLGGGDEIPAEWIVADGCNG